MNYRHAFHVGNHADVLKHAVLLLCLQELTKKPGGLVVLDTHAGRGRYDLESQEARRSPEWRAGVLPIWEWEAAPAALAPYRAALARANQDNPSLRWYPGSPLLAASLLRPQDRLVLCELHPEEAAALRQAAPASAQVHRRDGFAACTALLPPEESRGLVLLDPAYEQREDWARSVAALQEGWRRFRQGVYLWWRPMKEPDLVDAADAELAQTLAALRGLRLDLRLRAVEEPGMGASSVLVLNPPYRAAALLPQAVEALALRLGQGQGRAETRVLGAL